MLCCLESTYKELKQEHPGRPERSGTSLESTYKELKQTIFIYAVSAIVGLESTYKELKPPYARNFQAGTDRFRVYL